MDIMPKVYRDSTVRGEDGVLVLYIFAKLVQKFDMLKVNEI